MKLYLSSYGLGNHPDRLRKLVGENKSAAIIMNAQDLATPENRRARIDIEIQAMMGLGLRPEELDLRHYFDDPTQMVEKLKEYGLLWIRGGNVFVLQRAMRQSGFDKCIRSLIESEKLVYAGFSAGSCAATPHLHGIELVDDANTVPEGYDPEIIWEGLDLVPYSIAPHYRSDHYESEAIEKTVEYFKNHEISYKTLQDGQAIVMDGSHEEVVG